MENLDAMDGRALEKFPKGVKHKPPANSDLVVGSLFAGVGGIDLAFETAGFTLGWANEIDRAACETYSRNFQHPIFCAGIKQFDASKLKANVIVAGFPCQAFSITGLQKGFNDRNGAVFFDMVRVIREVRPEAIFLENVKNLLSHGGGTTMRTIEKALTDIGYHLNYQVLQAADFSSIPQNRERLYIVGFLNEKRAQQFDFSLGTRRRKKLRDFLDASVPEKYYYCQSKFLPELKRKITKPDTCYMWRGKVWTTKSGLCPTLTARMGTGGHNVPLLLEGEKIRKLTPRECFRLQGFPENYCLPEMADLKLYKQAGNSVSVPTVTKIAKRMRAVMYGCLDYEQREFAPLGSAGSATRKREEMKNV